MTVILWIWNYLSPIVMLLGAGYFAMGGFDELTLIFCAGAAILGFIIGFTGWGETVPPRWFWIKSRVDLFDNRFFTALGYAFQFFFLPAAIFGIIELI